MFRKFNIYILYILSALHICHTHTLSLSLSLYSYIILFEVRRSGVVRPWPELQREWGEKVILTFCYNVGEEWKDWVDWDRLIGMVNGDRAAVI